VTTLRFEDFQLREGRWVIADLRGKGGHIRTIPVPAWVKQSVDSWSFGAGINAGPLLRSINKPGRISEDGFTPKIKGSSIPYTIIRATQFFEFVKGIADFSADGDKVRLPLALIQPMAADDVASAVGRIATGAPVNGTVEVGGPEKFRLDELVRQFLAARKDPREVVADPQALYYGVKLSENTLLPGDAAPLGETRFEDWLSLSASQILPTKPLTTAVAAASNQSSGPQK
jgi:hypothetical protein